MHVEPELSARSILDKHPGAVAHGCYICTCAAAVACAALSLYTLSIWTSPLVEADFGLLLPGGSLGGSLRRLACRASTHHGASSSTISPV